MQGRLLFLGNNLKQAIRVPAKVLYLKQLIMWT